MKPDWLPELGKRSCKISDDIRTWILYYTSYVCMCMCMCAQACPTLCDPMDWSSPAQSFPTLCGPMDRKNPCPWDFSRQEYWSGLPISFSRECSQPRNQICSCTGRQLLYHCATWEVHVTHQWLSIFWMW